LNGKLSNESYIQDINFWESFIGCVGFGKKVTRLVIAEIGINHDGDATVAKKLIDSAAAAGCQAIKFQYRNSSRIYSSGYKEIGDEIISFELQKSKLEIFQIIELAMHARNLNLLVGISCFTKMDYDDISTHIKAFDFFKVPSVELLNFELIDAMLATGKQTYLSLGAHSEYEIVRSLTRISSIPNWTPMHCISNYPTAAHNAQLGYITYLRNRWNRPVGYSSHDTAWELCVAALTLGADVIERHITYSSQAEGLDHSTSSTGQEFSNLCQIALEIDTSLLGNGPKFPNQGEKLNRQNLGRSYFAKRDLNIGDTLHLEDFEYRSPQIGLNFDEADSKQGSSLIIPIRAGAPLTKASLLDSNSHLSDETIQIANNFRLSLPVRLHDYKKIGQAIPINNFEFHLSFEEIQKEIDISDFDNCHSFSVHVPDYLDSKTLFDPFSKTDTIRNHSRRSLRKVIRFASEIGMYTGKNVPIVSSFTGMDLEKPDFYANLAELIEEFKEPLVELTAQWLPPYAWYFGGSVKLRHLNSMLDLEFIEKYRIPLTMDSSHLFMCGQVPQNDIAEIWIRSLPYIKHLHLSDSKGLDGEGLQIGEGDKVNQEFFPKMLEVGSAKVLEIWQGHLDGYTNFKFGIIAATEISRLK
jgi:N-acetylneuraminate synthase